MRGKILKVKCAIKQCTFYPKCAPGIKIEENWITISYVVDCPFGTIERSKRDMRKFIDYSGTSLMAVRAFYETR